METRVERETGERVAALDVWRGLAITFLMLGHFADVPKINLGRLGVEFFFCLSGFLMGRILFVKKTPLNVFYYRRVSRIIPVAWLFVTAMILWNWVYSRPFDWLSNISCYFFFVNYLISFNMVNLAIQADHYWSLCVEEHTYVVLSVLALLTRKTSIRPLLALLVVAAICVCSAAVSAYLSRGKYDYFEIYWRTDCRASSILFGAIASLLASRGYGASEVYWGIRTTVWSILVLGLGLMLQLNFVPDLIKYSLGSAVLSLALLLAEKHGPGWLFKSRILASAGIVSFSLYVWQQPFHFALLDHKLSQFAAIGLAIATGLGSYFLFEKPCRIWLNSRGPSAPPRAEAKSQA